MIGPGGARRGSKGQSSSGGGMAIVGLFPGSADSDDEQHYHSPTAATPSPKKGGAVQQDWSIFPDKEETLAKPAAASAKGGRTSTPKVSPGITTGSTPVSEKVAGGNGEQDSGRGKKTKKTKKKPTAVEGEDIPSPLHAGVESDDLEAACGTRPLSMTKSAEERAIDEFELNKDRSPAEWMRVRDTTGTAFLWYIVILQIAIASCSIVYLASHGENQISWKTGCWGMWTSLADAEDVDFVEFDTHIGWQLYGKGDKLGGLSEVSERTAVIGGLAGGMHTLVLFVAIMFFFFSLSSLWLSYHDLCCFRDRPSEEQETDGPTRPVKRGNSLGLGRFCHRWMFVMAAIDIFAGLWCFGIGCVGFYFVITRDFTDGIEELISSWGEDVSCARPQTSPRYGYYVNALSVLVLVGGGIISLCKARRSDRDLREAVEMWENDRAETAEMESRLAMIKKKEEYAAAVASAAASAAQTPVTIFKSKRTTTAADSDGNASAAADGVKPVLRLSSPLPPQTASSATTAFGPEERHRRSLTIAALSSVDLESEERKVDYEPTLASVPSLQTIPESPCSPCLSSPELASVDWDVENGAGASPAPSPAAATPDNTGKGVVEADFPPPAGWEVRTTPSGDKFWVNLLTKNVSWEKPTE